MNELTVNVRIEKDMMVTDSRNVAEVFGKEHNHVLRDIRNLEKDVSTFGQMFFESTMPDKYGRQQNSGAEIKDIKLSDRSCVTYHDLYYIEQYIDVVKEVLIWVDKKEIMDLKKEGVM